jgi:2,4-dienoyl-CoA reductase-like NADH-dependent reductase (Old Yellow Enzyme family)
MPTPSIWSPLRLGRLTLRNRIVKTATYEGMSQGGLPAATLVRHHREIARGGAALTTVAYCAVAPEGRTFAQQLVMREEAIAHFSALTAAVHAEGGAASIQLAHAGGFSKDAKHRGRRGPLGPSFGFNAYGALAGMPFTFAMRDEDMDAVVAAFARSAALAARAGFDAVELHLGHGYLLSQFLSPHRNRRRDAFGGSLDNRLRFPLRVVAAVRAAVGEGFPVLAKINLDDGVPHGLGVDEAVEIARALERAGIAALVLSGGLVSHSAMFLMRGERPLRSMIRVEKDPRMKLALAAFGPIFVRRVPFTPLYFLPLAQRVRAAVEMPLVLLGGATARADLDDAMAAGFDLVAMGRALLHDPDLPAKYQRGEARTSGCTPCNECMAEMDRPGGVCCAQVPAQLARRAEEVAAGLHLALASG